MYTCHCYGKAVSDLLNYEIPFRKTMDALTLLANTTLAAVTATVVSDAHTGLTNLTSTPAPGDPTPGDPSHGDVMATAHKMHWVASAVLGTILVLVGLVGNTLSIVIWNRKSMKSSTGTYLQGNYRQYIQGIAHRNYQTYVLVTGQFFHEYIV
jgi:hypothetical protein